MVEFSRKLYSRKKKMSSPSKSPPNLIDLPSDVQIEIISRMKLHRIKDLCQTSKYFASLCRTERVKKIIKNKQNELPPYFFRKGSQNKKLFYAFLTPDDYDVDFSDLGPVFRTINPKNVPSELKPFIREVSTEKFKKMKKENALKIKEIEFRIWKKEDRQRRGY